MVTVACVCARYNIGQRPSGALAAQYGVVVCVSAHGVFLINRKYVMFILNICFYDPLVTSDLSVSLCQLQSELFVSPDAVFIPITPFTG